MERRVTVQDGLPALSGVGEGLPAIFGGLFFDQEAGGVIDIALTSGDQEAMELFRKTAPEEAELRFRTVRHSLAELEMVHRSLEELAELEPTDRQVGIGAIATNVRLNVVDVGIAAADRAALEGSLVSAFGDRIRVIDDYSIQNEVCTARSSCTPYRAGIDIYPPGALGCTSGFIAKKATDATYYMLTAGHCGALNSSWLHDEVQVGVVVVRAYQTNGTADAAAISRPGTTGHKDWIYVANSEMARSVNVRQGHDDDSIGESVCIAGKISGFWCGTITSVDADNVWDGVTLQFNMRTATYGSASGDSGAPVFYSNTAKGIHKGQAGTTRYYSHIWEVEQSLNVVVLTSPT